jgi:hypothetical protein
LVRIRARHVCLHDAAGDAEEHRRHLRQRHGPGAKLGETRTDEAVPFGDPAAARQFAAENGGRVVSYQDMPHDYVFPEGDGS